MKPDGDYRKISFVEQLMREYVIVVFTGISAFLGYNVWNMSGAVERLAVEVKYLASTNASSDLEIAALRREITTIREEQVKRSTNVYSMADVSSRLRMLERHLEELKKSK